MYDSVVVLNSTMEPLMRVDLKHAIRMMVREVAVIEESEGDRMIGHLPFPKVLRLVRFVKTAWRHARGPGWSRKGLMTRDGYKCGYCGGKADTVDHIVPTSAGGKSTWLNTVAACGRCNSKKGARTPEQLKISIRNRIYAPTWWELGIVG